MAGTEKEPFLIRFCHSKDRIDCAEHLQIGYLYKYHSPEMGELSDAGEGKYSFLLRFSKPTQVSNRWINTLFARNFVIGGARSPAYNIDVPGSFSVIAETNASIGADTSLGCSTLTGDFRVNYDAPNCLILCFSQGHSEMLSPFVDYEDRWMIPKINAQQFFTHLINTMSDLSMYRQFCAVEDWSAVKLVHVIAKMHPIMYAERVVEVMHESFLTVERFKDLLISAPFTKPIQYSGEREVRISINAHSNVGILPVKAQNFYFPLRYFASLVNL